MPGRLRRLLFGAPRDFQDRGTFHVMALIAVLAWVGLGADGLSSSAYGPDEAFRALGKHRYLAVALAVATAATVTIISIAYTQIIQRFAHGGGGYAVATRLLGQKAGLVSGSALLVDYVLTISVSIAGAADQLFSTLPASFVPFKLEVEAVAIALLVVLNLRGVRESVAVMAPIFVVFLVTHGILIFGGIGSHLGEAPRVAAEVGAGFQEGWRTLGAMGMLAVFLRAYSMGGGTYTGIEAVSNGLQIMREPKVATARRTMLYMAISLAITAGGILLCYLLFEVEPVPGKTMNAALLDRFAGAWQPWGWPLGRVFVVVALIAEAALLVVAAQTGFIGGPRVMANMANDSWLPHRLSHLSERLTMQDGVLLMGGASMAALLYTGGNITALVTMYSINVFVTFSLAQVAMVRYWIRRKAGRKALGLTIHGMAALLCISILAGTLYEKAEDGGWLTVVVTGLVVALCLWFRSHYQKVQRDLKSLDEVLAAIPVEPNAVALPLDRSAPTAVLLVGGYGGLGVHAMLSIERIFPGHFRNFIFVSVGVIDAATMKGVEEVDRVREETEDSLRRYVDLARSLGLAADYRSAMGTEAVDAAVGLCGPIAREYPRAIFFAGRLVFQTERWYQRLLHNETANRIQRHLQFAGLNAMVLPVRVLEART